ncbi:MAG: lytic transglycosylase domain-containing protein [Parvibaculum sp.]
MKKTSVAQAGLSALLLTVIAMADMSLAAANAASDDWALCRAAATRLEHQHHMPAGMVNSIAMVESGRRSPDGSLQAWPWTVNAEGRAYYFSTRDDAVDAVRRMLAEGKRTIDVGCMQVNLRYHPRAFTSVEEAFDPMSNVAYGAFFLRELEERSDSWTQAIGRYHSYSPSLNTRYTARVQAVWAKEQRNTTAQLANASLATGARSPQEAALSAANATTVANLRLSTFADEPGTGDTYRPDILPATTLASLD